MKSKQKSTKPTLKIRPQDFASRRKKFLSQIKNAVAVFPSPLEARRNPDVDHPFRQESNFFYLTGFEEPESICLLSGASKQAFQLFVQPKDPEKEMWEGKLWGPTGARRKFGADIAQPSDPETHFDDAFMEAMADAEALYYRVGLNPTFDARVFRLLERARKKLGRTGRSLWPILDPDQVLSELRLFKSPSEIDRLSLAAEISAEAHCLAMRQAAPGVNEYEIEATLIHHFRKSGAAREGYNGIIASGANACILHYTANNRTMEAGELLLIDAGCEFDYYTADITRTFPVSGSFSKEQVEIYAAVLEAQTAGIALARPGKTFNNIHEQCLEVLVENLRKLKILKGTTKSILNKESYKAYYPHGIGHWLGMDVHDVGRYYVESLDKHRKLKPGMCFTIEPGLYFAPDSTSPSKYRGIGVRIEDNILITAKGNKVLTSGVPKEMDEIESLCQSG